MTAFLQLHLLTFYPPSNPNRDDTGRPKTAVVGGVTRLRLSSQSLKRAWRKSDVFATMLDGHLGDRTQRMGRNIALTLIRDHKLPETEANQIARVLAALVGKPESAPKPGQELFIRQLAFVSPDEMVRLNAFLSRMLADPTLRSRIAQSASEIALDSDEESADPPEATQDSKSKKRAPKQSKQTTKLLKEIRSEILSVADTAADIAMFGRMLADSPDYNREAAVQVAHAITTHKAVVEDDFYTAVDDLTQPSEDAGAGFLNHQGFGSGVFYLYVNVNLERLCKNLGGNSTLAVTACEALIKAAATTSPSGKQNSFAARARADFILAEYGDAQPRTLAAAFARPVADHDVLEASIIALTDFRRKIDTVYRAMPQRSEILKVRDETGDIESLGRFCLEAVASCRTS